MMRYEDMRQRHKDSDIGSERPSLFGHPEKKVSHKSAKLNRQELLVLRVQALTGLASPLVQIVAAFAEPDALDWAELLLAQPIHVTVRRESLTVSLCRDVGSGACSRLELLQADGRPVAVWLSDGRFLSFQAFIDWLRSPDVDIHRRCAPWGAELVDAELASAVRAVLKARCVSHHYFIR
jgi:hypothetical protein